MNHLVFGIYTDIRKRPYRVAVYFKDFDRSGRTIDILSFDSYRELVKGVLKYFCRLNSDILRRTAELDDNRFMGSKLKTRRYIAEQRDHLYIASPHLTRKFSEQVEGYWVATNIGRDEATEIVNQAIRALGKKPGRFSELIEKAL